MFACQIKRGEKPVSLHSSDFLFVTENLEKLLWLSLSGLLNGGKENFPHFFARFSNTRIKSLQLAAHSILFNK